MLKGLHSFIRKRYRIDSDEGMLRFIALSVISIAGLVLALLMLVRDLFGSYLEESIPGDVSLFILFSLTFYNLYLGKIKWALNTVFLLPIVAYFFYVSGKYSTYPVNESIPQTVWCLLPGFLILLLFDEKYYKIFIYYLLVLCTLLYHLNLAGKLGVAFHLQWPSSEKIPNPLVFLTLSFVVAFVISWYYQKILRKLKEEVGDVKERINKTFKVLQQGIDNS